MIVLMLSQVITTLQRPQNANESNFLNKKSKNFLSRKEAFSTEFENLISNFHNITIVIINSIISVILPLCFSLELCFYLCFNLTELF